jgi:hypothetical protein
MKERAKGILGGSIRTIGDAMEAAYLKRDDAGHVSDRVAGADALRLSAQHVEQVKAAAMPSWQCGPELPVAPARGPLRTFEPFEIMPGSAANEGEFIARRTGYKGRTGAAVRDAFDLMSEQVRRARKDAPLPFTSTQVQMGRDYAALVERLEASGMRGSSGEVLAGRSGGGGGDWIEAVIRDRRSLRAIERRIGDGWAIAPRRIAPHADRPRLAIRVRAVVDMVCLGGKTIEGVLAHHGWSRSPANKDQVRAALAAALDRMMGYRDAQPQNVG